jgi:molecular chaperone GrpE
VSEQPDLAVEREQQPAADPQAAQPGPAGEPAAPVPPSGGAAGADADADTAVERAEEQLEVDLELLLEERARFAAERDEYLELSRRVQADFENYKKRIIRQQTEHLERAAAALIEKLLPVLDSMELALAHDSADLEPIHRSLMGVLEAEGLERIDPLGKPFDPNEHEAVAHEAGEEGPVVAEVLRPGYRFKGRVLRPAMVKVRG